jgi:hypothetical protein
MDWLTGLFGKKANAQTAPLKEVVVNAPAAAAANSPGSATAPRIHNAFPAGTTSAAVGGRRNSRKNRKHRKNSRKNRSSRN